MSGPFQQHGGTLVANGYQIVPIPMGTKGPRYPEWRALRLTSAAQFDVFCAGTHQVEIKGELVTQPNVPRQAGVGIQCTHTPGFDCDSSSPEMVAHMREFLFDKLGPAPVRVGRAPKFLAMYATSRPFRKLHTGDWYDPAGNKHAFEVLAEGQQFVAYHTHPDTGRPYVWVDEGQNPLDISTIDLTEITVEHAQAVVREFCRKAAEMGWELKGKTRNEAAVSSASQGAEDVADALGQEVPPDESEAEVARARAAIGALKGEVISGFSYDQWLNLLFALKWTRWICAEELARELSESSDKHDEREFEKCWRHADKRGRASPVTLASLYATAKEAGWDASRKPTEEQKTATYEELAADIGALAGDDRAARKELINRLAAATLDPLDEADLLKALCRVTKLPVKDVRRAVSEARNVARVHAEPTHAAYARRMLAVIEERTGNEAVGVEGRIWTYDPSERIWSGKFPAQFEVDVAREFDGLENCCRRNDYVAIATHAHSICSAGRERFFEEAPIGLAAEGRFYGIEGGQIKPAMLAAHHRQRVLAPVVPRVMATPLWDTLMDMAFEGDFEREQVLLLEELAGAAILGFAARYEKACLMKGKGRAGKGTILKILGAAVPLGTVCAVPPNRWDREYYLAELAGKRMNLVGELPDEAPIDGATFKTVTGRDQLTARLPTHAVFQFSNTAAHIFNSNYFIHTRDHSESFFDRWILIEFRNSLIGKSDLIKSDLAERIIRDEMPGVLAKLLQGAKRLLERGHFKMTTAHHKLMAEWRQRSSTMLEFMTDPDYCVIGEFKGVELTRHVFWGAYLQWCRDANRKPLGKQKFFTEFETEPVQQLGIRLARKTGNVYLVRGIALRTQVFDFEAEPADEFGGL